MVRVQKLTRNSFLTLHGHNVHRQQRQLSKFLMRSAVRLSCLLRGRGASFKDGVEAGKGLLPWPPRSPDPKPCNFFLWGFVKDSVYVPPLPMSLKELCDQITHALQTITADMLHGVWDEFYYRADVCRVTQGAHIEGL